MKIAVLGGGNGSFAAAGDMALAGHDVRLWRRDAEAVKAHNAADGIITVKDFRGQHEAKLSLVTNDIAAAVLNDSPSCSVSSQTSPHHLDCRRL